MQKSESCLFHMLVVVEVAMAAGNFWSGCANISFSQNRLLGESKNWAVLRIDRR